MIRELKTFEYICDKCFTKKTLLTDNKYDLPKGWKRVGYVREWSHGRETTEYGERCPKCKREK